MGYDTDVARALRPPSKAPWMLVGLLGAVGAGGGYHFYNELQRAKSETRAETEKATAAVAAVGAATATQKELTDKVEKLEGEKAELATAKEELSKEVAAKSGELAELKGTYDKLEDKMKDEIAKGDISLSQDGGRLRVGLVDKILFDSGEAEISKRGEEVLARVGAVLAAIDDKQIQVSGHTDNQRVIGEKLLSQFPTNWELSSARAVNVVRFLSEKANVPAQRLVASGYADLHPIASNKTPAGRARNRRIEILLTPLLDPKRIALSKLPKPAPVAVVEKSGKGAVAEGPARSEHPKKK
jgi:chemotaxis protein MotB